MTAQDAYNQAITEAYARGEADDVIERAELAALVQSGLGHPLDGETFNHMAESQRRLRDEQAELVNQLEADRISRAEYLDRLYELMHAFTRRGLALLGRERFEAIFGEAAYHPEGLIDREAFLAGPADLLPH